MEPAFLTVDEVIEIHRDQIERYGGSTGVRDKGLLESAIATPRASFGGQFLHADLCQMAAAYLFHIVSNHPFVDGNKRAGAMSAFVFLHTNGLKLSTEQDALVDLVLSVAQSQCSKTDVADFLRGHVTKA